MRRPVDRTLILSSLDDRRPVAAPIGEALFLAGMMLVAGAVVWAYLAFFLAVGLLAGGAVAYSTATRSRR